MNKNQKFIELENLPIEKQYAYIRNVAATIRYFISFRDKDYKGDAMNELVMDSLFGGEPNFEDKIMNDKLVSLEILKLISKSQIKSLMSDGDIERGTDMLTRIIDFSTNIHQNDKYQAMLDLAYVEERGQDDIRRVAVLHDYYLLKSEVAEYENNLKRA